MRTSRNLVDGNVIQIHIVARGAPGFHHDGDVTGARSRRQQYVKLVPIGRIIGKQSGNRLEGIAVCRVSHHTDLYLTRIAGRALFRPENELKRVDAVLKFGQTNPAGDGCTRSIKI